MRYIEIVSEENLRRQPEVLIIQWVIPRAARNAVECGDETIIWVDVEKIDAAWSSDRNMYVGPGGTHNAIRGRYERFDGWIRGRSPVEMSEMGFDAAYPLPRPYFSNGRHRFSWMRDHGAKAVPVVIDVDIADKFSKLFGSNLRKTEVFLDA